MAPRYFAKITLLTFILSLAMSTPVLAASPTNSGFASPHSGQAFQQTTHQGEFLSGTQPQGQGDIKEHVFKFFLDPALVSNMNFAKSVLPKYVEDMNTILAKNTNRRLVFNPETDIILRDSPPNSNQAISPLPVENFEIWAYAVPCDSTLSYGGYVGLDTSGAGVLAGLKWTRLYDPDELSSNDLTDYWTQINNMLHELAHVFGAGIGEYYQLAHIRDSTGVSPSLDINILDPNDAFWSDKQDFMADPLLQNAAQTQDSALISSRQDLLDFVKYSNLTAALISGDYRNAAPMIDLQQVTVSVVTDSGEPIPGANVKIWSVVGNSPYPSQLMVDTLTDSNGQVVFAWGGSPNPHNNYDFLRLIKVYQDGYLASVKYVSIYDADIVKLVDGSDLYNIRITLNPVSSPTLTSIIRADPNPASEASVDFIVKFSEPVIGVDFATPETDFSLITNGITGAAISEVSGSGSVYVVTVNTGRGNGTISLEVPSTATITDLDGNPIDDLLFNGSNESYTVQKAAPGEYNLFLTTILQ